MATKEYETLARDMEENFTDSLKKMEAACIQHINANIVLCNDQIAAQRSECKQAAFGIFIAGGCVGALIAAILLKV